MTPLSQLYDAIVARLQAQLTGVQVLQRENTIQFLRHKPSAPTVIVNWSGAETQQPPIIGQSHQQSEMIWTMEVFAPGAADTAEELASALANDVIEALAPAASTWSPADDCGPMRWERTEALGETETGYVIAVAFRHVIWR